LLARVRDVQPGKTHPFRRRQKFWKPSYRKIEFVEINELVDAPDSMFGRLLLMDRGKPGCLNPGTDETQQEFGCFSFQ
jgi:hypothetical protein